VPVPPPVRKINSKGTTVLNARRASGKSKRPLKTTPVLDLGPNTISENRHTLPRARPRPRQALPGPSVRSDAFVVRGDRIGAICKPDHHLAAKVAT
jgi:hypothetical protein